MTKLSLLLAAMTLSTSVYATCPVYDIWNTVYGRIDTKLLFNISHNVTDFRLVLIKNKPDSEKQSYSIWRYGSSKKVFIFQKMSQPNQGQVKYVYLPDLLEVVNNGKPLSNIPDADLSKI